MAQYMVSTGKVISYGPVSVDQLRPGDLLFYGNSGNGRYLGIYHVSMYYGNGYRLENPLRTYWESSNTVIVARPYAN
jgi:cell wall-associated NlpC family hydrolase